MHLKWVDKSLDEVVRRLKNESNSFHQVIKFFDEIGKLMLANHYIPGDAMKHSMGVFIGV